MVTSLLNFLHMLVRAFSIWVLPADRTVDARQLPAGANGTGHEGALATP